MPKSNDLAQLKPKEERNFIKANLNKVVYEPTPSRAPAKEEQPTKHKAYGNVPKYLDNYKKQRDDAVRQKAIDEENAKLPPGTRLMGEEERLATLEDLLTA